jgi:hypothetical protein
MSCANQTPIEKAAAGLLVAAFSLGADGCSTLHHYICSRLAEAFQLRHSRAEQERSSVAKTLESIPLPQPKKAAEQNFLRPLASLRCNGTYGLRRVAALLASP